MTHTNAPKWLWFALVLSAAFVPLQSPATTVAAEPVIASLRVAGTNLVFDVVIPAGAQQGFLEMRPTLTDPWQEAAQLNVSPNGGNLEFTIPVPALDAAFFRLRITSGQTTNSQPSAALLSTELQYVTIPPLGPVDTNGLTDPEAVFHFKGIVDGSDRIRITREGAFWQHVNWRWPAGAVNINGSQWNPQQKNYLTTTGAVTFLPAAYSISAASLERIKGRDVVALERTNDALIVYLVDTPSGAAMYDFKIHFRPASPVHQKSDSVPATLKIADTLHIQFADNPNGADYYELGRVNTKA